jgi:hypothetical protein
MSDIDETLEQLFSKASPRPRPDAAAAQAARESVRAEWRTVTGQHRMRRKIVNFAVAATVLIAVFSLFNSFRPIDSAPLRVASIQKSFGSIFVLGEQSELTRADDLATIHAGQTIVTGDDAGIALAWSGGGSVRLDKDTEVEFISDTTVFLHSGRLYFDSTPSTLIPGIDFGGIARFEIDTDLGLVNHVGTQFMTEVESDELRVSVREGQVGVTGRYYPYTAAQGEQVVFTGRQRPVVFNFAQYGDAWEWVTQTSPAVLVDGQSVHVFLDWVGRELGMRVEYGDATVEDTARDAIMKGHVDTPPAEALRMRMLTAALDWHMTEGVIYVSNSH